MLTRLIVKGFKNLVDVNVSFGPFTCIAGPNGVGKSNLFDVIQLLSALAEKPLREAAVSVRSESGRAADIKSLFHQHGAALTPKMSFAAEMIIPPEGVDDLGQQAKASITFLRYSLELAYVSGNGHASQGDLEITKEELVHITRGDAAKHLPFRHSKAWRDSVIQGRRTGGPFISTVREGDALVTKLHQDGGSRGRPTTKLASMPRTMLSAANAAESPTALLARREMQSWRLLQLEPAALRKPDEFNAPRNLGSDGSHLPAALFRLAHPQNGDVTRSAYAEHVYAEVANRLSTLIEDIQELYVDRDEKRELLTVYVKDREQTRHAARSLSDGTLRFLALTVLANDNDANGVLCLEEPENGIHPKRIPAMLQLLQDICVDTENNAGAENPLRQVIINTHSPAVVREVPDDSLLIVDSRYCSRSEERWHEAVFSGLSDTWRAKQSEENSPYTISGLLDYLGAETQFPGDSNGHRRKVRRVRDRGDVNQMMIDFPPGPPHDRD